MGRNYKKVLAVAAVVSLLVMPTWIASAEETSQDAIVLDQSDTSVFKPAALKSLNYDDHYRLYKYDVISVRILGYENSKLNDNNSNAGSSSTSDLSQITIGPDGYVNLPYAGSVKLAGLTLDEARSVLANRFGRYIKIPDISIMVNKYGSRKIQVLGEVNTPGTVNLASDDMNVLSAISKANWVTTYGRLKKVQVIRIIDGVMYVKEANIKNYIEKHDITQNYALEDGDILYIPKSNKIDFHKDILPIINVYSMYKALTN